MKAEDEPITPDELVIRLIWKQYYNPSLALPIQQGAFSPKPNETDGISVFRAACVASPEDVLTVFAADKQDGYAIALGPVAELAKIDAVPGHAVLPELNIVATTAAKPRWRIIQKQLAALANDRIVRPPKN
jgi:hypothetical protein